MPRLRLCMSVYWPWTLTTRMRCTTPACWLLNEVRRGGGVVVDSTAVSDLRGRVVQATMSWR